MADMSGVHSVFAPKSIAILGASSDPTKMGNHLVRNLSQGGYPGKVFPISRSGGEIHGVKSYPTLKDVGESVELVLFLIPVGGVVEAMQEAAEVGAKAAVVFTSGFKEGGPEGEKIQNEMVAAAKKGGIRIIGPNCLGVRNFHLPMNATPVTLFKPEAGPISLFSQSGAFGNGALATIEALRAGVSKLASIGNMSDITHADLFRYALEDDETKVITAFIEGVPDVDDFLDAIAEVAPKKPIIILKPGRSKAAQRAAMSHTSSLAGDGRIWDALIREAGGHVATSSQELFDVATAFARAGTTNMPKGRRVAIVTLAGGPGVLATDHLALEGLETPPLKDKLVALKELASPYASLGNPVDITGNTKRENFGPCCETIAGLDTIDAVFAIAAGLDIPQYADAVIAASQIKPTVASIVAPNTETTLIKAGVPNFASVDRAARALRHMVERGEMLGRKRPAAPPAVKAASLKPGVMTEAASKKLLASYGMTVTAEEEVLGANAAADAAKRIGFPVALKVSSADVAHKTDKGGVLLGLKDEAAVRDAAKTLGERFPGAAMLVQQMVAPGVELIVGAQRNPATGAIVMVGIGGVLTEVLDDVVFARAPAAEAAILAVLPKLRAARLLDGYRGAKAVDRNAVAKIAAQLSAIMAANPNIVEVDLNPVIAGPDGAIVVDALIRVE